MKPDSDRTELSEAEDRPSVFRRVEAHIQGKVLAGLLDLVPTIVTVVVVLFLVQKVDSLIRPLPFVEDEPWGFPGIGLVVCVVLLYFFGLAISTKGGSTLSLWRDRMIGAIPVVRTIFGVTRQVMSSVTSQYGFSRVVFRVAEGWDGRNGLRNETSIFRQDERHDGPGLHSHYSQSNVGKHGMVMEDDLSYPGRKNHIRRHATGDVIGHIAVRLQPSGIS